MAIDKELWLKEKFSSKTKVPNWPCPICHKGILQKEGESISQHYTKETLKASANLAYITDAKAEFRFTGFLLCSNCKEKIIVSGNGIFCDELNHPASAMYRGARYPVYFHKYFEPSLNLFTIPDGVPKVIKKEIESAFSLYWIDHGSCGNRVRSAVEFILTEEGIKQTFISKKKKRILLSLHERIEKYQQINPEIANYLLAIKWLGNSGSHSRKLIKKDLLDGFVLLEYVLDQLYHSKIRSAALKKLSKSINKRKGPIKRKVA